MAGNITMLYELAIKTYRHPGFGRKKRRGKWLLPGPEDGRRDIA